MRESQWPTVDAESMRRVDDQMENQFGISLLQMMENAGRSLAWLALEQYAPRQVSVLAGGGGNGGGGLVAARHLANKGVAVCVFLVVAEADLDPVPRHQLGSLRAMGLPVVEVSADQTGSHRACDGDAAQLLSADLIIDAMIGYSLAGPPREPVAGLIRLANENTAPILSLDVPSGFDASSGVLRNPHVQAATTLTIAAPKRGLLESSAAGDVFVADIGVPLSVYRELGATGPEGLFEGGWVVPVTSCLPS